MPKKESECEVISKEIKSAINTPQQVFIATLDKRIAKVAIKPNIILYNRSYKVNTNMSQRQGEVNV